MIAQYRAQQTADNKNNTASCGVRPHASAYPIRFVHQPKGGARTERCVVCFSPLSERRTGFRTTPQYGLVERDYRWFQVSCGGRELAISKGRVPSFENSRMRISPAAVTSRLWEICKFDIFFRMNLLHKRTVSFMPMDTKQKYICFSATQRKVWCVYGKVWKS